MLERAARDYAGTVRAWLNRVRRRSAHGGDAGEPAGGLESRLEELEGAEEEVRLQREELREALDQADRERRRYEELFQHAPAAYLTTDRAGRIREANVAAARLLRLPPSHAAGKALAVFVGDREALRSRLARLARMEQVEDWDTEIMPRDGGPVPVRLSATGVEGADDGTYEIRWLVRDVRHERAAHDRERELQQEQAARAAMARVAQRANQLADMSGRLMGVLDPDAVWTTAAIILEAHADAVALVEVEPKADDPTLLVRLRARAGTLTGRRLDPILGRPVDIDEAEAALRLPAGRLANAIRQGEPEVVPMSADVAYGDPAISCLVVPLRGRDAILGAMVIWLGPDVNVGEELLVNRHLSDRVALALETAQLFQEVMRARQRAEEAGAAEADFLSMISHELRTPLTAIVSYAELLEDRVEELPEKLRRYAHQIAAAAHHQKELVDQVLSYKGLQEASQGTDPQELDFRDVVNFAVGLVRPQAEDRPVELETELPGEPVRGTCDAGKVRQIMANLLANAVRHTREGHVRVSLSSDDRWVEIRVQDTGEGIRAEDLPRVYDRFWRGSAARDRTGSGLGLTIVRELVARMQGEIAVESEVGVGTTFTVRLPRHAPTGEARSL